MTELSALATAAAIRAGDLTALNACEAAIARIEARDGAINAVVVRDFAAARAAAAALDAAGPDDRPLFGVPMTVKESFDVAGLPTTFGFEEHRDHRPTRDAVAVARLKAAGAVILGKTNVPPGLADLQSTNPVYGRTSNPHAHDRVAGGSSGGSAAALASGMVALEIGSDIGGSIRVPAHFNGVWGLKTTYGALSRDGHVFPRTDGHAGPLSVIGPLARDADDLAVALDVLADVPLPCARVSTATGLRVLLLDSHPLASVADAIRAVVERLGQALERAGAQVMRHSEALPDQTGQFARYMRLLTITMARGAPSADGAQASLPDWFAMLDDQARTIRAWQRLFGTVDAVIAPVLGVTAFPHSDVDLRQRMLTIDGVAAPFAMQFGFPGLATYPNLPACAVPLGADADGLPIGLQVITAHHRDHDAIAIGRIAQDLLRS
jgi:amidase